MRTDTRAYAFCGVTVISDLELPQLRRVRSRSEPSCSIALGAPLEPDARVTWFHQWRRRRGPRWLSLGRIGGGSRPRYLLRFPALADFEVSADGGRIVARPAATLPDETLRHLLIDQVLPLDTSRHGRLSLHASAVYLRGIGTIAFVGEAGRGKSTLAAAFAVAGARVVADDCLAIELAGNGAAALPAYPGLRLWPASTGRGVLPPDRGGPVAHYTTKRRIDGASLRYQHAPSPLRALFLLRPRASRGPAAAITRCGPAARVMGLLRYAYVLDVEDRAELAGVFDRLAITAARVPVLRLRLRHGYSRLASAAEMIRDYAAQT